MKPPPGSRASLPTVLVALLLMLVVVALLTAGLQVLVTSRGPFGIDFYVYWMGGRAVFLEGENPYSPELTRRTQLGLYGRESLPGEDVKGFAYPPYGLLAVYPSLFMPYAWAQAFWLGINLVTFLGVLHLAFPNAPRTVRLTAPFVYPLAYGLIMGQLAVTLVSTALLTNMLVGGSGRWQTHRDILAGILIAWLTAKPQMTWPLVAYFLLLAFREDRRFVVGSFLAGLAVFTLLSWVLVPGWPAAWLRHVLTSTDEALAGQPLYSALSGWLAPPRWQPWLAGTLVAASVAALTWIGFRWWSGKAPPTLLLVWLVWLGFLVHPLLMSPDQGIALLPLLVALRRQPGGSGRVLWLAILVIPWALFLLPLPGWNSYLVTRVPPLLFGAWAMYGLLREHPWPQGRLSRSLA